jgi:hypothetical protein
VTASAVVAGGTTHGFTQAKIRLNGEVVLYWASSSGEPALHHISKRVMFDSTHFPDDSEVTVEFLALGDDEVWYEANPVQVPVRNFAGVFGRYDLEVEPKMYQWANSEDPTSGHWLIGDSSWNGTYPADMFLQQANYGIYGGAPVTNLGWTWLQLEPAIAASSVFYVNTHGGLSAPYGQAYFETDSNDWNLYYPQDPPDVPGSAFQGVMGSTETTLLSGWFTIDETRISAIGGGLPPFNTGNPPVTLAWIDGCRGGVQGEVGGLYYDGTFPEAFLHPVGNAYSPPPSSENQAFCGSLIDPDANRTAEVAIEFFSALRDGFTVNRARELAYVAYMDGSVDRNWRIAAHSWMAVYGDWAMRLHGVYTGIDELEPVTAWFRPY